MSDLRSRIIRLAAAKPELRTHLLPLVSDRQATLTPLQPGDYLVNLYSYDQDWITYYQVLSVSGSMVTYARMPNRIVRHEGCTQWVVPATGSPDSVPKRAKVRPDGRVKIDEYRMAYKWNGVPREETDPRCGR
jgi:hypothetical protein